MSAEDSGDTLAAVQVTDHVDIINQDCNIFLLTGSS